MTNFEKIKNLSIEEMANFIFDLLNTCDGGCINCVYRETSICTSVNMALAYLESEVEK